VAATLSAQKARKRFRNHSAGRLQVAAIIEVGIEQNGHDENGNRE
jgi:hypothetical protein